MQVARMAGDQATVWLLPAQDSRTLAKSDNAGTRSGGLDRVSAWLEERGFILVVRNENSALWELYAAGRDPREGFPEIDAFFAERGDLLTQSMIRFRVSAHGSPPPTQWQTWVEELCVLMGLEAHADEKWKICNQLQMS